MKAEGQDNGLFSSGSSGETVESVLDYKKKEERIEISKASVRAKRTVKMKNDFYLSCYQTVLMLRGTQLTIGFPCDIDG